MEKVIDAWCVFWQSLPKFRESIAPYAKRSGISPDAAIILTVYAEFKGIELPIKAELIGELTSKGLLEVKENISVLTSRGEILAKSFVNARKGIF